MRQTLNDSGVPTGSPIFYDPWGLVQSGTVPTFGFTGEVQQGSAVYLRARWYTTTSGTFTSKDPFAGFPTQPYSLHPYQYGYSNPALYTDPSGKCGKSTFWETAVSVLSGDCTQRAVDAFQHAQTTEQKIVAGSVAVLSSIGLVSGWTGTAMLGGAAAPAVVRAAPVLRSAAAWMGQHRIITGTGLGGGLDYLSQVATNRQQGLGWGQALTNVNKKSIFANAAGGGVLGWIGGPGVFRNTVGARSYAAIGALVNGSIGALATASDPTACAGDIAASFLMNGMSGGIFSATSYRIAALVKWFAGSPAVSSPALTYTSNIAGGIAGGLTSNLASNAMQQQPWDTKMGAALLFGGFSGVLQSFDYLNTGSPATRARIKQEIVEQQRRQGIKGRTIWPDVLDVDRNRSGEFFGDTFAAVYSLMFASP